MLNISIDNIFLIALNVALSENVDLLEAYVELFILSLFIKLSMTHKLL